MSSGATAMRHGKAVVQAQWPEGPVLTARQVAIRTKKGWRTTMEDVFGVFDFLVMTHAGDVIGIQVTTQDDRHTTAAHRKRKIRDWIYQYWGPEPQQFRFRVLLWAWVKGSHFREWEWGWEAAEWIEGQPVASPLIKS